MVQNPSRGVVIMSIVEIFYFIGVLSWSILLILMLLRLLLAVKLKIPQAPILTKICSFLIVEKNEDFAMVRIKLEEIMKTFRKLIKWQLIISIILILLLLLNILKSPGEKRELALVLLIGLTTTLFIPSMLWSITIYKIYSLCDEKIKNFLKDYRKGE